MAAFPIPGEAAFESSRYAGDLLIVRNVRLGMLNAGQRLDAVLDTAATDCIVPTQVARLLGFDHVNRMGWREVRGLDGSSRVGGTPDPSEHTPHAMMPTEGTCSLPTRDTSTRATAGVAVGVA